MSQNLSENINNITNLLNDEKIKNILSLFCNSNTSSEKNSQADNVEKQDTRETVDKLNILKDLLNETRKVNDPRINLIKAIQPFLGKERQSKLSECINFLQLSDMIKELEKLENDCV